MNLALLFSFQGRINRAKFWLAILVYVVASFLIFLLLGAVGEAFDIDASMATYYVVAAIIYIPILISGIAVGIKRLHDRNKSGWWLLFFYLAPWALNGIGWALGGGAEEDGASVVNLFFSVASFAISIWMLVELGFLRGTVGPNQYGPDPLPPAAAK